MQSHSVAVKVKDLKGAALNYAVRFAETGRAPLDYVEGRDNFATCWNKAGPIIEREAITVIAAVNCGRRYWVAERGRQEAYESYGPQGDRYGNAFHVDGTHTGPTPIVAALRCYVAGKFGDSVSVPAYLLEKVAQP